MADQLTVEAHQVGERRIVTVTFTPIVEVVEVDGEFDDEFDD
jgi:hypothetical protein